MKKHLAFLKHAPGSLPGHKPAEKLAVVPAGITEAADLLETLGKALEFPGWNGKNWNALRDALEDLEWLKEPSILIFHEEMPGLPKAELEIYLTILAGAVAYWQAEGSRALKISVPAARKTRK